MSDTIRVSRELLEDVIGIGPMRYLKACDELRALLSQPAADCDLEVVAWQDAENPSYTTGEKRQMHGWATDGYQIVELVRKSDADALQSELNDRRETICRLLSELDAVPKMPSVSAMAKALSDKHADEAGVNRADTWKQYSHEYIEDVEYMLATAPHVSLTDDGDA